MILCSRKLENPWRMNSLTTVWFLLFMNKRCVYTMETQVCQWVRTHPRPVPARDQEKGQQGPAPGDMPSAWGLLCPGREKVKNVIRKQLHVWKVLYKGTEEETGMG